MLHNLTAQQFFNNRKKSHLGQEARRVDVATQLLNVAISLKNSWINTKILANFLVKMTD